MSDVPQVSSLFGVPVPTEECFSSDLTLYKLSVSATEEQRKKENIERRKEGENEGYEAYSDRCSIKSPITGPSEWAT